MRYDTRYLTVESESLCYEVDSGHVKAHKWFYKVEKSGKALVFGILLSPV